MTNKDSIINHVQKISWFDHDETDGNRFIFSTRQNGNVGEEQYSEKDINEARRVIIDLNKHFQIFEPMIDTVDEWVYLEFEIV